MTKTYTIEVTKESRALVTVDAESNSEAQAIIKERIEKGEIEWTMKDHVITDIIRSKEKTD